MKVRDIKRELKRIYKLFESKAIPEYEADICFERIAELEEQLKAKRG